MLKEQIHNRVYVPGDRINIDSIAKEFGVSNSPIREAINMLITDGLLENVQNSSPRVVILSDREQEELYSSICVLLLGSYSNYIVEKKDDQLVAIMEERLEIQKEMMRTGSFQSQITAAMEFDQAFMDVAGNGRILSIYQSLMSLFYLSVQDHLLTHDKDASIKEHTEILAAIRAKDQQLVQVLVQKHYSQST